MLRSTYSYLAICTGSPRFGPWNPVYIARIIGPCERGRASVWQDPGTLPMFLISVFFVFFVLFLFAQCFKGPLSAAAMPTWQRSTVLVEHICSRLDSDTLCSTLSTAMFYWAIPATINAFLLRTRKNTTYITALTVSSCLHTISIYFEPIPTAFTILCHCELYSAIPHPFFTTPLLFWSYFPHLSRSNIYS